jgi:hypothetical protein
VKELEEAFLTLAIWHGYELGERTVEQRDAALEVYRKGKK